jgi:phosphopantothenoylcysteine synthetase/decarboxylase
MSHILELSDRSDGDDECPALIEVNDEDDNNKDDDDNDGDKTEEPEESAEAELGQLLHVDVYRILKSPLLE